MKTKLITTFSLLSFFAMGQDPEMKDPFFGQRIIASANDVLLAWIDRNDHTLHLQRHDFISFNQCQQFTDSTWVKTDYTFDVPGVDNRILDAIVLDLNEDGYDEIITVVAVNTDSSSLVVMTHRFESGTLVMNSSQRIVTTASNFQQVRLQEMETDGDIPPEVIVTYHNVGNNNVHLRFLDWHGTFIPEVVGEHNAGTSLRGNYGVIYDILADDINQDGISELLFVGLEEDFYNGYRDHALFGDLYTIQMQDSNTIELVLNLTFDDVLFKNSVNDDVVNLRLTAGNYTGNQAREFVLAYQLRENDADSRYFMIPGYINRNLTSIDLSVDQQFDTKTTFNETGRAIGLSSGDINFNQRDDIIFAFHDRVHLYQILPDTSFARIFTPAAMSMGSGFDNYRNNHVVVVSDLDASNLQPVWSPEIAIVSTSEGDGEPPHSSSIQIYQPVNCEDSIQIIRKSNESFTSNGLEFMDETPFSIVSGRFDDSGIILGAPFVKREQDIQEVLIVVNAPPNHFDIINGLPHDVADCYNEQDCDFRTIYDEGITGEEQITTTQTEDWGVDATARADFEAVGNKLSAHVTGTYGESFSKVQTKGSTVTIGVNVQARNDDMIFATVSDYEVWEYPIYETGEFKGYLSVTVPQLLRESWFSSKSLAGYNYIPDHEVGNILSYPSIESKMESGRIDELIKGKGNAFFVGPNTAYQWRLETKDFEESQSSLQKKAGLNVGLAIQLGYEGDHEVKAAPLGLGTGATYHFRATVGFEVNGNYSRTAFTSHQTSVKEEMLLRVELGDVPGALTGYSITPYAYWSRSGAFVIDYAVEPERATSGNVGTWWQKTYGVKTDPSLMLPWRLDEEKGYPLAHELQKTQTKSIIIEPRNAVPGDTVHIYTRVHNYSLKGTSDPVKVQWYMGDPDVDGDLIVGADGTTEVFTVDSIVARGTDWVTMDWVVPDWKGRIYAVLDGDQVHDEIHEDNNKGWVAYGYGKDDDIFSFVGESGTPEFKLYQNFPNPFSYETSIPFYLEKAGSVSISIFDMMGKFVARVDENEYPAGEHLVEFDGSDLEPGIYFYRMEFDHRVISNKMVVMR